MQEDKKLKVGIFIDSFFPMIDGVVNVVNNHAKIMNNYADVTVFAPKGRGTFDDNKLPYKVVRCSKRLKLSFLDYDLPLPKIDRKFIKEMENSDFDIIHIHSPFSMGRVGLALAKKKNIPVIATIHSRYKIDFFDATKSEFITDIMAQNVNSVYEKCNECYAVNKQVGRAYTQEYGLKKKPKVQNNGTDLVYYDNEEEIDKLRKKYQVKEDEKILFFVGRMVKLKNIFFILDALKILKDKNFKYKMIYVGDGPDLNELKEKIEEYNLSDQVIVTGKIADRNEIVKHYRLADLFLFPSVYDCSSLVQIEAASQKTPTIFIRGSVTSGTCTEGVDAFFCEYNVEDFASRIIEIFNDKKEYEKIKDGAYNNLYVTWEQATKKVYEDYLKVIENYKNGKYSKEKIKEIKEIKKDISEIVKDSLKDRKKQKEEEKKLLKKEKSELKKQKNKSSKTSKTNKKNK